MTKMTRDDAFTFISAGTRTGSLATASPTGKPHVAPVWFVVDGDDIVFNTGATTVKGRNLAANPRAAMTVDEAVYPYTFVVVRGPVLIDVAAPDLRYWATQIAERYVPSGQAEAFGERNAVDGELLVRLRIEHIAGERGVAL